MKSFAQITLLVLALGVKVACNRDRAATTRSKVSGPAAAVQTTTYHGVGVVKSMDFNRPSIEIDHEDIKELMPAMTMEFYVRDKPLLNGIKVNDRISLIDKAQRL